MLVIGVRLYFANKQANIEVSEFFTQSILPVVKVIAISAPFYFFTNNYVETSGYLARILLTTAFLILILFSIYILGLSYSERAFIIGTIKNKIFKKK